MVEGRHDHIIIIDLQTCISIHGKVTIKLCDLTHDYLTLLPPAEDRVYQINVPATARHLHPAIAVSLCGELQYPSILC